MQAVYLVATRFFNAPDLFLGLLQGLALCFILIGILSTESYSKLKKWKNSMFKKWKNSILKSA